MTSPEDGELETRLYQEQSTVHVQQIEDENKKGRDENHEETEADQGDGTPHVSSFNISTEDLDEPTLQKLRGDVIGDTVVSQSAVLKTIMQLENMQWSKELEDDLCFLWDSTVDDAVCLFLAAVDFPVLVQGLVVEHFDNDRFVEILVGIVANMLSSKCEFPESSFTKEQVLHIVSILHKTDDPLILVQVLRYADAVFHSDSVKIGDFLLETDVEKLNFFLNNSTNVDLLVGSLKIMSKYCILHAENKANNTMLDGSVFASAMVAQKTVAEATEYWSEQHRHAMVSTFEILNSLLGESATTDSFRSKIGDYLEGFMCEFLIFLNHFSSEYNADPSGQFLYCLNTFCDVCIRLRIICERHVLTALAEFLKIRDLYADVDLSQAARLFHYFMVHYGCNRIIEECNEVVAADICSWVQREMQANRDLLNYDYSEEPEGLLES